MALYPYLLVALFVKYAMLTEACVDLTGDRYEALLKAYGLPIPKGPRAETRREALRVFIGLPE